MSIKIAMVLTSLHMHLTCQEKEQVDVISMHIFKVRKCLLSLRLAL